MNLLIVSASSKEINLLKENLTLVQKRDSYFSEYIYGKTYIDFLVSGVGIASTSYQLGKFISKKKYDLIINLGIAGAFHKTLKLGQVVHVTSDIFSELGAENDTDFIPFDLLPIDQQTQTRTAYRIENTNPIDSSVVNELQQVNGITVNTIHGNEKSIADAISLFSPDIESMEGAAFLYVCKEEQIKCAQIRAISNYVEKRNRNNWDVDLAIKNLTETALRLLNSIN